jgi:protein-L-isoaspartate(D-aspartate) O-methyltransferase
MSLPIERRRMVERQIRARGIRQEVVLRAMEEVPRERFLPEQLAEFAYSDSPLPIAEGQTISQPYIVALMTEALALRPHDRVLEVGTGSGYAAAVLSRIAARVFTIERHGSLAEEARSRLAGQGYTNVEVRHGDGSLGWPEEAPFDAIVVAAGGPSVPQPLLDQLAIGGRLVIPVGATQRTQELLRVTRAAEREFVRESLGGVRFVPLVGARGWAEERTARPAVPAVPALVKECAEPIDGIDSVDLGPLLERIGDARVVLLGEATHGTSEFYRMRTRITEELVRRRGFRMVAVEADWPDAAQVDRYVRGLPARERSWTPFSRFPQWMWRNREVHELIEWLRAWNLERAPAEGKVSFHGLDLYSLYTSIGEVLAYLERVHPPTAAVARERYGRLTPWEHDPAVYGRAVLTGRYRSCEAEVVEILRALLVRRLELVGRDGEAFFDAVQNARVVQDAEAYYRTMYYGGVASWNLRDRHMFETLMQLLAWGGADTKVVVWEHNSHIGNADATEMRARGEHNVGSLTRAELGSRGSYHVGFGTDHGIVAAASEWNGPLERKRIRPAHEASYERLCHTSGVPAFLLHLARPRREALREELMEARLERAIGVLYLPETELQSHYSQAVLPQQFDEYVWFDETSAVTPLGREVPHGVPETYPFGL